MPPAERNSGQSRAVAFRTTRWTLVMRASNRSGSQAGEALAELYSAYWFPVYAFIRRQGHQPADAEDLTQEFFARLIEKNYLDLIEREGGKFRSYLLTAVKRFLAKEWDRANAKKRGGGQLILSWDAAEAEAQYELDRADHETAETLFERKWAATLLANTRKVLAREYAACGKAKLYDQIAQFLAGTNPNETYKDLATRLGYTEALVKVAIHRLRKRFGEILRDEVSETVENPSDVDEELKYLIRISAGSGGSA